ncbi:hypothetical protein B0H17DRAFT_1333863 [Mycena rosella]|uniref:Uncharacterized protein n=1 Tax=Mycena rosella TaxID=1033263 RepID=A0AAD7D642_MYCRO|nr:hypothetical protein B0H17DRAFT_1333863 [Mycena rosella]
MENLPAEIHLKIYRSACRDDGTTGSSLSSVSKHIRSLSAEYRYQSIAVCGPIQIHRLLTSLRCVPPELRRIRFLFVYDYFSLSRRHGDATNIIARDGPPSKPRARFHDLPRFHNAPQFTPDFSDLILNRLFNKIDLFDNDWDRLAHESATNVGRNIIEMLAFAQETVELLSLICFDKKFAGSSPLQLLQGSFPTLSHLTVRGPHELPDDPAFAPVLRTLHLTDKALRPGFFTTVAANHPFLARLRISRFMDIRRRVKDIMGLIYVMRVSSSTGWARNMKLPPQMDPGVERLILVEPSIPRLPTRDFQLMLELLRNIHARLRGFILLPRHAGHKLGQEGKLALADWTLCAMGVPMKWGEAPGKLAWDINVFDDV